MSREGEVEIASMNLHGFGVGPDGILFRNVKGGHGEHGIEDGIVIESQPRTLYRPDSFSLSRASDGQVRGRLSGELMQERQFQQSRFS